MRSGRGVLRTTARCGAIAGVCIAAAAGCAVTEPEAAATVARARFLMGTRLEIEAAGPTAAQAIEQAFAEVERLDAILSNWRGDSEVSRLNAAAADAAFRCSPDLFAAATTALHWAERTGGAFDPTVEPLVRRLGLRGGEGRLPGIAPEPEPDPAAPLPIGWRLVQVEAASRSLRYRARGMGLDFGGIGKGIALDAAAAVLRRHGTTSARLDFGGQTLVFGAGPDEGGWRLGLSDPDERDQVVGSIVLRSGSLAASGNAERSKTDAQGRTVSHLLDPATGRPARYQGSVTVIAPDATSADALSTALFVMGPERGLAWAEANGLDVLYLSREPDGTLRRSARGSFLASDPGCSPDTTRPPAASGGRP